MNTLEATWVGVVWLLATVSGSAQAPAVTLPAKSAGITGGAQKPVLPLPPAFVVPNFHPASCGWL